MLKEDKPKIKELTRSRELTQVEVNIANKRWKKATSNYSSAIRKLAQINTEINILENKPSDIVFTDHALLRYIERTLGVDMDAIRNKILTDDIKKKILIFNTAQIPTKDGFELVVRDKKIITIITKD